MSRRLRHGLQFHRLGTVGGCVRCRDRGIWACVTATGRAAEKQAAPTQREVLAETLR
jgi:hypothetical protein